MKKNYLINLMKDEATIKHIGVVSVGPKSNNYARVYFLVDKPVNQMTEDAIKELLARCGKLDFRLKILFKRDFALYGQRPGIFEIPIKK